jgi:GNAT superfamily N-acetyltransferase
MSPALSDASARARVADLTRNADLHRCQHRIELPDGRRVALRPLRREDRDGQAALFAGLSHESRRRRFLSPKRRLSSRELDHLSDVGHARHEAMAAVDETDGSIVGVSRYVVHAQRPHVAEIAMEVADDYQCHGIGKALVCRTVGRARASGIVTLTATTLWENIPALALLTGLGFRTRAEFGAEVDLTLDL